MRRLTALSLLLFLAACGGSTPTSPPPAPPPAAPGPPASLSVQTGDGQEAEPGITLAVKPAVLVKDAAGRPVPNISVSFSVDSGAGTVSPATATTGSDGIASTGWTMGPSEGNGVLLATAAGLPAARLRATVRFAKEALLTGATVPSSGGTVTYTNAGDPLSGLSIQVPDSAYPTPTSFTVSAVPTLHVPLPPDVKQLGPAFLIGNGKDPADLPMALKLPLHAGGDSVISAFFYDPASGTLEAVPLVARDDASITVASKHFSADQLLIPGGGASLRAAVRGPATVPPPAFGQVFIIGVVTTPAALNAPLTTGFTPGVDDWEFVNYGTYAAQPGICAGMSITAMYYYYRFRPGGAPLNHQYDTYANLDRDNPDGERFASAIQRDANWANAASWLNVMDQYASASRIRYDQLVYQSLALTMKVTHQPQFIGLERLISPKIAHAVVAYAMKNGVISFSDPNFPGLASRTMTYANGVFTPLPFSANATTTPLLITEFHLLGVSAMVPTSAITQRWNQFVQHTKAPYFPIINREYFDVPANAWLPIPASDLIVTTSRVLAIRSLCPACKPHVVRAAQLAFTELVDLANTSRGNDFATRDTAAIIAFGRGPGSFQISVESQYEDSVNHKASYVDQHFVTIMVTPFIITPAGASDTVDAQLDFVAEHSGQAQANWTFTWDFGDGTQKVTKVGDSTVTHQWTTPGTFQLKAELRNVAGSLIARDQDAVIIKIPVRQLLIAPLAPEMERDTINFTATLFQKLPPNPYYVWSTGIGKPDTSTSNTHPAFYPSPFPFDRKTYTITVDLYNGPPGNKGVLLIASASTNPLVWNHLPEAWRITSFQLQSMTPFTNPKGNAAQYAGIVQQDALLQQVVTTPSDGLLFLADDVLWPEPSVYFQVAAPGTGASVNYWQPGAYVTQFARSLKIGSSFTGVFSNGGDLSNGSLSGYALVSLLGASFHNTISAVKNGNILTGTVSTEWYLFGQANRTYSFVATRVR